MNQLSTALPHGSVHKEGPVAVNKVLVILNVLLIMSSVVFFIPVHLLSTCLNAVVHQLSQVRSIFFFWIAVNIIVSIAAIRIYLRVRTIKERRNSSIDLEEEGNTSMDIDKGYLCIKVSGSKNMIWLNGQLYDLSKNNINSLAANSAEISLSKMCN